MFYIFDVIGSISLLANLQHLYVQYPHFKTVKVPQELKTTVGTNSERCHLIQLRLHSDLYTLS